MSLKPEMKRQAFVDDDQEDEINADFSIPVAVNTKTLSWQASPVKGVLRKRLELAGKGNPRLTTLVQFTPGSSFDEHSHDGGEEFLVLSGVFSDASGDYGPGSYVRNPPGTRHAPFSREGCTLLVKLRQFQVQDRKQLAINATDTKSRWISSGEPGVSKLDLHHYLNEQVNLYRINPYCWMTNRRYEHGVEIFVYEGSISDGSGDYPAGSWLRYPVQSKVRISSPQGARVYMKQGAFPN